ncbi:uncharacterized protein LOC122292374 [Carya illinoinensis]|uniref:J domain-containing protein n=2 Tax=Carya illinoinensis TaxID=32201 RepID=A0A8T1NRS5_CARIL|nr:uncharacterized protein LOC122292374 [Carya illinoinensis]KAG6632361.1 hypothetical protein CIPAW_13G154100 [Carya illinoinensis]KAG6682683.1 hypothetical protein I3842_13G155000 [Carya illinoinensis]
MLPALLDPAAPVHTTPQNPSLNGQFSHSLSFNFSGLPSKFQSVPMNPSNIGNQTSGFSDYSNSNSGFNTSSFTGSATGSSRPRFVKVRRHSNSHNLRPTGASDDHADLGFNPFRPVSEHSNSHNLRPTGASGDHADLGFNPFRPVSEHSIPASSASQTGASISGGFGFGKSGSESFVFGANIIDSGADFNLGKWDSRVGLENGVVANMRNLKIGNEDFVNANDSYPSRTRSSLSGRSGSSGFVFSSGDEKSSGIDEGIASMLPEEMRKLNIESLADVENIKKNRDVRFNLSTNDKTNFGFGSDDNVSSSFDRSVDAELPNEFKKKLGIKEAGKFDGAGSSADTLPDQMKNLNMKDPINNNCFEKNDVNIETNDKNNATFGGSESTSDSYGGRRENLLLRKMEKLKLGSGAGYSNRSDAGLSSPRVYVKETQTGDFSEMLLHDLDKSAPMESNFQVGMQGENVSGSQVPLDQPRDDIKLHGKVASSASFSSSDMGLPPVGNAFEVPKAEFSFTSRQDATGTDFVEFKTPKPKDNIFSGLNQKMEFSAKREPIRDTRQSRLNKKSGKLKHSTPVKLWPGQYVVSRDSVSQENTEVSESYSPMDISPYQETPADNRCSRENSVTSEESFRLDNNYEATNSAPSDAIDEGLIKATQCLDINEDNSICEEAKFDSSEYCFDKIGGAKGPQEGSVSGAETESFKSAAEDVDYNSDVTITSQETEAIPSSNIESCDSDDRMQIGVTSSLEDINVGNFTFAASSATQGQLSSSKRHQKKKNLLKVAHDMYDSSPKAKVSHGSSSVNLFPFSGTSLPLSPGRSQKGDLSISQSNVKTDSAMEKRQEIKLEPAPNVAAQEVCEKWRQRGNQAYMNGDLSKAEDCYTKGVNSVSMSESSRGCLRVLMLCYSNRAATRMALGRIRDALGDCMMAAAIDPNFLKVQLRAANCYLSLGEVEDASKYFKRCLQSGSDICVDRKIAVEASDGLQKAQKVIDCMNCSAEILIRTRSTANDAETALEVIAEALMISPYSEKLLEMKTEALFMLRRYDEVIQLCDQTLGSAEKNSPPVATNDQETTLNGSENLKNFYFRLWRCRLTFQACFHLGRLEEGLALLEQDEITNRGGSKSLESLIPLVGTVRKLLHHKAAGNEAFQAGLHAEAVEHYTAALSFNVESRPFAAVCFCNRAAAYKALGQITDAIADCSLAIALDGNYLKALSRRATLYEMIRDYGQAAKDLQRLVSLLNKQVEQKTNQSRASDRSISGANDLRQARLRLSEVEEEARKEIPLDMYHILGIEPSVSASEIKKAYRKAALRHHPDKAGQSLARSDNGDDKLWKEIAEEVHRDADKLFKMIGEAYAVLSDPIKRSRYDAEEEMRNAQKKRSESSTARTHTDAQYYPYERSGSGRHWREVWRSYGNSASRGPEDNRWGRHS